ncbi:3-hydroxyacyl-CoA dehydrogenase [Bordetella ansorpii]|uniref:3-hydroxyacyl-CoA dehydrogenase n=1 Tax=Bordetella ansorpii TaxID=288768 RepID=A0A157LDV9_9BORD|nr:3-hydroxyacyl-CoA dehydrogenase [Bordetella ansorpii]SAH94887.1 3-hydroxyacyl-CoA dehydrogenase [Bordetella ansorpii]
MSTVAIIGCGLIGQGWAIVFARSGWQVRLHDPDAAARAEAPRLVRQQLLALEKHGLLEDAEGIAQRVGVADTLADALAGVDYVQENSPERLEVKLALFAELDRLAPPEAIIGSSTSSIPTSAFTAALPGRARCLVAHPVNPPYLVPVVELSGAPWTDAATIERAREIMCAVGQKPVTVRREIEGFVLNRLQGALLQEAFRLVQAGIASAEDIDVTVKDGLGLRWSFMGPFETIDLNAPGGIADYCARYGGLYASIGATQQQCVPWEGELVDDLQRQRRQQLDASELPARRFWRDDALMRLLRHKQERRD